MDWPLTIKGGTGQEEGMYNLRDAKKAESQKYVRILQPYHPEHALSRLISEAKQGRAWLVFGWETVIV